MAHLDYTPELANPGSNLYSYLEDLGLETPPPPQKKTL